MTTPHQIGAWLADTARRAAALIAVNWGLFIYATAIDHVVEVALG